MIKEMFSKNWRYGFSMGVMVMLILTIVWEKYLLDAGYIMLKGNMRIMYILPWLIGAFLLRLVEISNDLKMADDFMLLVGLETLCHIVEGTLLCIAYMMLGVALFDFTLSLYRTIKDILKDAEDIAEDRRKRVMEIKEAIR